MSDAPSIPDLTLLRRIGRGSYGEVWIARTVTGVYRAVKIVYRARFEDDRPFLRELDGITRFQKSAGKQTRQLALMHVGTNEAEGFFYYVMELADDVEAGTDIDPDKYVPHTLKALFEREKAMPAEQVVRLAIELTRALHGLHQEGLIHRDVKPSNIILVAGTAKIADIGLVSSGDHTLTSLGTPGYSPPEGAGTIQADIYSLGRILYEMVTGRRPTDFPLLPKDLGQRKDAAALLEMNEIVLRACAVDPKDRYANTEEMLNDLLLVEAGKSVQELFRMRRRLKQLGRMALVSAGVAAIVVAGLGIQNYFTLRKLAATEAAARMQAEEDERLARYTADLNLAQLAINKGNVGAARIALRRAATQEGKTLKPDLEWKALWGEAVGGSVQTIGELNGPPVSAIMPAPGRRYLASQEGDRERLTVLWDLETGERRELIDGSFRIGSFSADGSRLIVGMREGTLRSIDLATGEVTQFAEPRSGLIEQEGNSPFIATARRLDDGGFTVTRWNAETLEPLEVWHSNSTEFKPTGRSADVLDHAGERLAIMLLDYRGTELKRQLQVIDLTSGNTVFAKDDIPGSEALAFSADGKFVAVGTVSDGIRLLEATSGVEVRVLRGHEGQVFDIEFSPDSTALAAVGTDQALRIWSIETGESVAVLRDHEAEVMAVRWLNDRALVTTSRDGTVRRWNLETIPEPKIRSGFWDEVLGNIVFDPDSLRWFATLSNGRITAIDRNTFEPTGPELEAFHPLAFKDNRLIALSEDLELVFVEPDAGEIETTQLAIPTDTITSIAVASADGSIAAFGRRDGRVIVWDLNDQTVLGDTTRHSSYVFSLAISPSGDRIASGSADGTVVIWNRLDDTVVEISPLNAQEANALAFTPDGERLLFAPHDGSIHLLDAMSGETLRSAHAHTQLVTRIAFNRNGSRVVTSSYDGTVAIYEATALRPISVLSVQPYGDRGNDYAVSDIAIASDGSTMMALTETGQIRRWTLTN